MRKLILAVAAIATIAMSAPALALEASEMPNLDKGNQGCYWGPTKTVYKNPGKMFQAIRQATGNNPKQHIEAATGENPPTTVGEFIWRRCVEDPRGN